MDEPTPRQQTNASAGSGWSNLPRDLAADVHGRLSFVDRLAFTAVFGEAFKQEAPCLLLRGRQFKDTATVFSLVDRRTATVEVPDSATVQVPDPAFGDRVIMGSSGGWLVTADKRARMHMLNPVTGEQAALPAIATMPFIDRVPDPWPWFTLDMKPFSDTQYENDLTSLENCTADQIRFSFYSKVVLSAKPRPCSYAAMLILDRQFGRGAAAFATDRNPAWRLAPSRDGIEDAIHHSGRFYSITFSGVVEVWEEHDGEFTSKAVMPSSSSLAKEDDDWRGRTRKYLAATLDGRLMVLIKKEHEKHSWKWKCFFTVQVLDDASRRWEEAHDIGEAALFVGVNSSLCVSTREHPELTAGCVYFTDDQLAKAAKRHEKRLRDRYAIDECCKQDVGVYSLKNSKVKAIEELGWHPSWPPPAWFTPSFS